MIVSSDAQVEKATIVVSVPMSKHRKALRYFTEDSDKSNVAIGTEYSKIVEAALDAQSIRREKRRPSLRRTGALIRRGSI